MNHKLTTHKQQEEDVEFLSDSYSILNDIQNIDFIDIIL